MNEQTVALGPDNLETVVIDGRTVKLSPIPGYSAESFGAQGETWYTTAIGSDGQVTVVPSESIGGAARVCEIEALHQRIAELESVVAALTERFEGTER